ncbi:putative ankyrin repeat protein RF_0381 [Asterias rubens]|uniref:putative ankyrin repeat protein RF_0381 n=1 Tax=Asterias rubens TaxID=7604 RepID=UPI001454FEC1|nr:putative ankyrin repeat protein RF_0381 [Asterias rubens]
MTFDMIDYTGSIMAQVLDAGEVLTTESKATISRFLNCLRSLQQPEVISIFDLAKTAYLPGRTEQVINLVTKLQFDVNFPIPTNGMTLFLCACISGSARLVSFLLDQDGDVTVTNKDGDTPLYLATFKCAGSSCSDFRLIQTLISVGCNVNAQNHKGNTPLHWAASEGDVELIKFLLTCGADRYIKNNIGMYPIGMATNNGHLRAGKHLKISLPNNRSPWDMFEPNTPGKVRLGLMRPQRDCLAMSPRPRMKLNFS